MPRDVLPAPDIPQSLDELTPGWLTAALRASGHLDRGQVRAREVERLGEGQGFVGEIVRLRLAYEGASATAPESVIAKMPIRSDQNRKLGEALGAYEREIRFYQELADEVPIAKPTCYHAAMDPNPFAGREKQFVDFFDRLPRWLVRILLPFGLWLASKSRRRYLLLLEDLAPARRLGDQVAGCSPDEAARALCEVARVHAAWWQRPGIDSMGWVMPIWILSRYAEQMYRDGRSAFFEVFGQGRSERFHEVADWLVDHGTPLMQCTSTSPSTLIHGDYRLDNLFFEGHGPALRVTVFDWQTVSCGPGAFDAAYFISGNLAPEVAREHAMDLLRCYHDALVAAGVEGYGFEACLADYERAILFITYRMIAGMNLLDLGNERGIELIRVWLERLEALLPVDYPRSVSG
jgi:hypothetical protein